MTAYYNENDPTAAAWLRELINAGHIAPGIVDERSIEDVAPNDVAGYTQCHFFAGIGVWSYALRLAGWPDNRPIWTASCPCQPFSSSGRRGGFDDERHLWPHLHWLVQQRRPSIIVGEQVASKAAGPWIDLVQTDLEALGYAFGCVAFPSAGVGAPHIRDRAYWVADGGRQGLSERVGQRRVQREAMGPRKRETFDGGSDFGGVANTESSRRSRELLRTRSGLPSDRAAKNGDAGGLGHPNREHPRRQRGAAATAKTEAPVRPVGDLPESPRADDHRPGPTNGLWRDADWLHCRDRKWRPVEPGTFPLANGAPARVGRLRGYGNAINAEAARAFIEVMMEN